MDAEWNETRCIVLPPPGPHAQPTLVTTLAFDHLQELLWAGNDYGRITSFYGPELQRYTSYRGHTSTQSGQAPVKQLLFCDKGVLSVSLKSVHLSSRRGPTQWHIAHNDMIDLRCMSFTGKGTSEIVVAGCQPAMLRIDVEKGTITEKIPAQQPYTIMKRASQYICAATCDGSVHVLDPNTFSVARTWKAYEGGVNDMDARSDLLLTCGWAPRHYQGLALEPLVKVFDLKLQKTLPPISFHGGAANVRIHHKMSTYCSIVSQSGVVYSVDILNPDKPVIRYTNYTSQVLGMELAPSGRAMVLYDSHCQIRLWGGPDPKLSFTEYPNTTEFADEPTPTQHLDWTPEIPLSIVGMPFYREMLFSAWPRNLVHEVGAPPTGIDATVAPSLKRADYGSHAPHARKTRRYQLEDTRAAQRANDTLAAPRFLSEKAREDSTDPDAGRRMSDALEALGDLALEGSTKQSVPVMYMNVEIKYSKFGVEDFDFKYYNRTEYSGLETHIANSYANPLLQLLRFTPVIRNLGLHHTALDCGFESCLLCELGFLFDMLEKAEGQNCQATNFLRTFSKQPEAAALGLLEEHATSTPLTVMIQNTARFLLKSVADNYRYIEPTNLNMEMAIATTGRATKRCAHCGFEHAQDYSTYCHDLVYPPKQNKHSPRSARQYFSQILKASVESHDQQRGWCPKCNAYRALSARRVVQNLPAVLMLNAAIHTSDSKQLWSTNGFLPREIGIIVNDGQIYCYEGQDLKLHLQRRMYDITVYELVGVVADINSGEHQKPHLVATIDVAHISRDYSDADEWHLFNDFLVRKTAREEALRFDPKWKLPSVLAYQVKAMSHIVDDSWKGYLDTSILYRSVIQPSLSDPLSFRQLSNIDEVPTVGTPCPIDAEFVQLLREEIDVKADGSREVVRPARRGLARVSVLRGAGTDEGLPFIDDYIAVNDPIDDYLTQHSGLRPGDLTPGLSRHSLVNIKVVYKKLWVLLNLGCTFIGHGLASDFRIINIHIPKVQVIDTLGLFSLKGRSRRNLSLRFLAWFLLKEDIQQNAELGHDSIEDARTALRLWRKYQEYVDAGILEQMLDEIFHKGRETNFKPPEKDGADGPRPETPSGSLPGTPARKPANTRTGTPARIEFGSPLRGL